jgi:beta-lactamase regulating signal transducer with metallopeptidase domain
LTGAVVPIGEPVPSPAAFAAVPPPPDWLIAGGIAIWLAMAAVGIVRIALGVRRLASLKARSRPLAADRRARLAMWNAVCGSPASPELRVSDDAPGASALGLGRPVILLSQAWVDALSDEDLDQIVMHERAHLARHDDWLRVLQAVIASVAGLHPAVRFVLHRIDIEREAACDDHVVSHTGAARRLAACLVNAAARRAATGAPEPEMIPAAVRSASTLRFRVHRLLDAGRDRSARLARTTSLATIGVLMAAVSVSGWIDPVVVFLEAPVSMLGSHLETIPRGRWAFGAVPAAAAPAAARTMPRMVQPIALVADRSDVAWPSAQTIDGVAPPLLPEAQRTDLDAPLVSRVVQDSVVGPPPSITPPDRMPVPPEPVESWAALAGSGTALASGAKRAGLATGDGARKFGTSIGRFFRRGGGAVASNF